MTFGEDFKKPPLVQSEYFKLTVKKVSSTYLMLRSFNLPKFQSNRILARLLLVNIADA